ncbi:MULTISPECIES: DUF2268 domain-containing protein [unclassified Virgibacillus]|uniref:DUF2268 domain-containing protein n=1 Tax=unclassified Virgibacillus TaxID=2620237 RepID=UPI0024DE3F2D|nr:DUF2268 domain-containing protein [Virgibacillus sp. LDC-1]
MGVIPTNNWLLDNDGDAQSIGEKLSPYFSGYDGVNILRYLQMHGLDRQLGKDNTIIEKLNKMKIWELVRSDVKKLKAKWNGPDIPIFIFPSDSYNKELRDNYNSKSGLSFRDKLFLFVSEKNTATEIKALFTHEYNHVCRLHYDKKDEADYILLDSIILEGLAENAVQERFGEAYTASWTSLYSDKQLEKIWNDIILPSYDLPKALRKHRDILYGMRFYPKMAGYCAGYYKVKQYLLKHTCDSKTLFKIPSEQIAGLFMENENRRK